MNRSTRRIALLALPWALLGACRDGEVPNFHLIDQNPASRTYAETVSPRDFIGQVSAWYFGNAG